MDKIGRTEASRLLSQQVAGARYFFLPPEARRPRGVALVLGGCEHCNPDYVIRRNEFPFHGLEFVMDGRGELTFGKAHHDLRPGTVFAYSPRMHCEIRANAAAPLVKFFLCLAGGGVERQLRRAGLAPGTARQLPVPAEITGVLEDIVREGQRAGPLTPAIGDALLALLLLKIEDAVRFVPRGTDPARAAFLRCKALIDARAETLTTLEEIARATGVEASSICRWFRRFQGTSPYQYLLRRKMNLAAEYLVEHGGLVKEVAQRIGFSDPYHFSRAFKSVHGIPPRALLRYGSGRSAGETPTPRGRQRIAPPAKAT